MNGQDNAESNDFRARGAPPASFTPINNPIPPPLTPAIQPAPPASQPANDFPSRSYNSFLHYGYFPPRNFPNVSYDVLGQSDYPNWQPMPQPLAPLPPPPGLQSVGNFHPFGQAGSFGQQAYGQTQQQMPPSGDCEGVKQSEYGPHRRVRARKNRNSRVDKPSRSVLDKTTTVDLQELSEALPQRNPRAKGKKKKKNKAAQMSQATQTEANQVLSDSQQVVSGEATARKKHTDKKIMLKPPLPPLEYFRIALEPYFAVEPPHRYLVVLDLNGTLIYRPDRNKPTKLIARPFLKPFLRYLFENFAVMVWSSAKPKNVKAIVDTVLDAKLRSRLVGIWARDTFGLHPSHYDRNVQVYKDLRKIWDSDPIQRKHPGYKRGQRFSQYNTILLDDSVLKAAAQPHNICTVPEFEATPGQMKSDILREVAGYLQTARMQSNVSSFMREYAFKADGNWMYDWPNEAGQGGRIKEQVHGGKIEEQVYETEIEEQCQAVQTDEQDQPGQDSQQPRIAYQVASSGWTSIN